jgi:hypothetical protein
MDWIDSDISLLLSESPKISNMFLNSLPEAIPTRQVQEEEEADGSLPDSTINPATLSDNASIFSSLSDSFPDSFLLPVHELTLLRAFIRIGSRLGTLEDAWNPTANSAFNRGLGTPAEFLPEAWRPTSAQILMPHHPILDFLPWPTARERAISMLNIPDEARPERAKGSMALVNFAYDMEDSAEGVRIWGSDPHDPKSWEVGQLFFEKWWFIFDSSIIEQSNHWRRLRGAAELHL